MRNGEGHSIGRMGAGMIVALLLGAFLMVFLPANASADTGAGAQVSVGVSVSFGPPPLPVYAQPICPGPEYIWTPGYWAWDPDFGYYWVPGTWVLAPFAGALWTPGYWGWDPAVAVFIWHGGYWGPVVGFYGGINYGFGYFGRGYEGGEWRGRDFYYNRAVNNINVVNVRNVYNNTTVINNVTVNRVSYNGGRGGLTARPTSEDMRAERSRRMDAVAAQQRQETMAQRTPSMRYSSNRGRPEIAATPRAGNFMGRGVERATEAGGPYRARQPVRQANPQNQQYRSFGQPAAGGGRRVESRPANGQQPSRGAQQDQTYRSFGTPQQGNGRRAERQPSYNQQPQRQPAYNRQERQQNNRQPRPQQEQRTYNQQRQRGGNAAERGGGNRQPGNAGRQGGNEKGGKGKQGIPHDHP